MARCSFAKWHPLQENWTEPSIDATQFVFHTQVGYFGGLYSWFNRRDVYVESHFGLSMGGLLEQMIDTDKQADAQYYGNVRAISLECEDKGNPNNPYTDAQLEMMLKLGRWATRHHPIPRRICASWTDPGFGWHSMWGAPSNWTPVAGKTCPGDVRIHQLRKELFPILFRKDIKLPTHGIAVVVKDEDGLDAGIAHTLASRISTLIGLEIPVLPYETNDRVHHAIVVGDTRDINPREKFPSVTIYTGQNRRDTARLVDTLIGG